jgi:predicted PurR-regulated permease PerM
MARQEIVRRSRKSFLARRILLQMYTLFPVHFAWYLFAAAVAGLLLYLIALIAPVLTPFLLSAVLACICLPIGILSAPLVFVPYLGALFGLLLGTLAGFNQFDGVLLRTAGQCGPAGGLASPASPLHR